jgi:hypothetical protein
LRRLRWRSLRKPRDASPARRSGAEPADCQDVSRAAGGECPERDKKRRNQARPRGATCACFPRQDHRSFRAADEPGPPANLPPAPGPRDAGGRRSATRSRIPRRERCWRTGARRGALPSSRAMEPSVEFGAGSLDLLPLSSECIVILKLGPYNRRTGLVILVPVSRGVVPALGGVSGRAGRSLGPTAASAWISDSPPPQA